MSNYLCLPCGYIYTESKDPKQNVAKFDELPINWACPECGSLKHDFEIMEKQSNEY